MLEHDLERKLREKLSDYGFLVLKLTTPGHAGVMDRMILRPRYSPGPPLFVELKKPGKAKLRPLQVGVGLDWSKRGCNVLKPCLTVGDVEQLCHDLIKLVAADYAFAKDEDITCEVSQQSY